MKWEEKAALLAEKEGGDRPRPQTHNEISQQPSSRHRRRLSCSSSSSPSFRFFSQFLFFLFFVEY